MSDNALWIASLTAGTAVLASWVTSWGTTRAARIQADTVTTAQREERRREARRTAYANLIEQAQRMGDLYWKVTHARTDGTEADRARLVELRERQRDEYGKLRHCVWIVSLEGPETVADAADTLRHATTPPYRALEAMIEGDPSAADRFEACRDPFWQSVISFAAAAREVLRQT
ncbi:hypothetical protein E0500_031485 [Streptomyces sp. KM273126]|uniref:hypothetical protein n=1 Tax=Streptomyces sp. KM273126 TaxID=2545247 RepID=UPI00103B654C|nr:hypothetical protein [Streptomyces sp. KM273126]MBA2811724.1 hypothetical protein [Streptomyces sp. KM273126]